MANFLNPTNSRALNLLPVNAGRLYSDPISITGDTEVVTYASYRLSFTALIDIASKSDLTFIVPLVKNVDSKQIEASTDIPLTKAIRGVGRDVDTQGNTSLSVSSIRQIGRKIALTGDTEVIVFLVNRDSYTGVVTLTTSSTLGVKIIRVRNRNININKISTLNYRVNILHWRSIDKVIKVNTSLITDEILQSRDGYLKISLCPSNPILTPAELTSSCNNIFFTNNSNIREMKYYGNKVFQ